MARQNFLVSILSIADKKICNVAHIFRFFCKSYLMLTDEIWQKSGANSEEIRLILRINEKSGAKKCGFCCIQEETAPE